MVNIIEGNIIYFIYKYVSQIWGFLTMRDPNITPNLWFWIGTTIAISNPILRSLKSSFHWAKPRILKLNPYETIQRSVVTQLCPVRDGNPHDSPWTVKKRDFEWHNSRKTYGLNVNWFLEKPYWILFHGGQNIPNDIISIFLMVKSVRLPYSKRCFISQLIRSAHEMLIGFTNSLSRVEGFQTWWFLFWFSQGTPPFEYPEVRN